MHGLSTLWSHRYDTYTLGLQTMKPSFPFRRTSTSSTSESSGTDEINDRPSPRQDNRRRTNMTSPNSSASSFDALGSPYMNNGQAISRDHLISVLTDVLDIVGEVNGGANSQDSSARQRDESVASSGGVNDHRRRRNNHGHDDSTQRRNNADDPPQ